MADSDEHSKIFIDGDFKAFINLLKSSSESNRREFLNKRNEKDESLLFRAAVHGRLSIAQVLLRYGVDIDAINGASGSTALIAAAQHGHTDMVKFFLKCGASVDIQTTESKLSALIIAVDQSTGRDEYVKIAQLLLEYSADVDLQECNGASALIFACQNGHFQMVKLLLEYGANINILSDRKQSALMIACMKGYLKIAKMLLENKANVNIQDTFGQTALILACQQHHTEIAKLLLSIMPKQT